MIRTAENYGIDLILWLRHCTIHFKFENKTGEINVEALALIVPIKLVHILPAICQLIL